jgi:hypothetical protein
MQILCPQQFVKNVSWVDRRSGLEYAIWNHVMPTKQFARVPPNNGKQLNPKAPTVVMIGSAPKIDCRALLNT